MVFAESPRRYRYDDPVVPTEERLESDDAPSPSEELEVLDDGRVARLRREAAGTRRRLRETEAERDALRGQVATLQRAEIERVATTDAAGFRPLLDGDDLWRAGIDLAEVVGDDGAIDADLVRAAVCKVAEAHPHWLRPAPPAGNAGVGLGGASTGVDDQPSFGVAVKGAR